MFTVRGLSVLQYADGYTGWLYKTADHIFDVTGDGYLDSAADMFRAGDTLVIVMPGGDRYALCQDRGFCPRGVGEDAMTLDPTADKMALDPTLDEMRDYLLGHPYADEADSLDVAQAIYWFANDWHSGQWSNLYAALCGVGYTPGACENGCEPDGMSTFMYEALEAEYAP